MGRLRGGAGKTYELKARFTVESDTRGVDEMLRRLNDVEKKMKRLDGRRSTPNISERGGDKVEQRLNSIEKKMTDVGDMEAKIKMVAEGDDRVETKLDNLERKANDMTRRVYNMKFEANTEADQAKVENLGRTADNITRHARILRIMAQHHGFDAVEGVVRQLDQNVEELSRQRATIHADIRNYNEVQQGITSIRRNVTELTARPWNMEIDGDITQARSALQQIAAQARAQFARAYRLQVVAETHGFPEAARQAEALKREALSISQLRARLAVELEGVPAAIAGLISVKRSANDVEGTYRINIDYSKVAGAVASLFSLRGAATAVGGVLAGLGSHLAHSSNSAQMLSRAAFVATQSIQVFAIALAGVAVAAAGPLVSGLSIAAGTLLTFAGGFGLVLAAMGPVIAALGSFSENQEKVVTANNQARNSANAVAQAQQGVEQAYANVERVAVQGAQQIAQAERAHAQAVRDAEIAQEELTAATNDYNAALATEDMRLNKLSLNLEGMYLNQEQLALDVAQAEREITEATTEEERQRAMLRVRQLQHSQKSGANDIEEATHKLNDAQINGTDELQGAYKQQQSALRGVEDANSRVGETALAVDEARMQANQQMTDALAQVAQAEQRLAEATLDNQDAMSKLSDAMSAIPADAAAIAAAAKLLWDNFTALSLPARQAMTQLTLDILHMANGAIPHLAQATNATAAAMVAAFWNIHSAWSQQGVFDSFINILSYMPSVTGALSEAMGYAFGGLINIMSQMMPFVQDFAFYLRDSAQAFLEWTNSESGRAAIHQFFVAAAPVAQALWYWIKEIAGGLIAWSVSNPQAVADIIHFVGYVAYGAGYAIGTIVTGLIALNNAVPGVVPLAGAMLGAYFAIRLIPKPIREIVAALFRYGAGVSVAADGTSRLAGSASSTPGLFARMGGAFSAAGGGLAGLRAAMTVSIPLIAGLTPPVWLVVAAVAAFAAAAYLIYQNWGTVGPWLAGVWEGIRATASAVWNYISADIYAAGSAVWSFLTTQWGMIQTWWGEMMAGLGFDTQGMGTDVYNIFSWLLSWISSIISTVMPYIVIGWQYGWMTIVTVVSGVWQMVSGIISGALQWILGFIMTTFGFFKGVFTGDWSLFWNGLSWMVSGAFTAISGIVQGAWTIISGIFYNGLWLLESITGVSFTNIYWAIAGWLNSAATFISGIWSLMNNDSASWGDVLYYTWDGIWRGIADDEGLINSERAAALASWWSWFNDDSTTWGDTLWWTWDYIWRGIADDEGLISNERATALAGWWNYFNNDSTTWGDTLRTTWGWVWQYIADDEGLITEERANTLSSWWSYMNDDQVSWGDTFWSTWDSAWTYISDTWYSWLDYISTGAYDTWVAVDEGAAAFGGWIYDTLDAAFGDAVRTALDWLSTLLYGAQKVLDKIGDPGGWSAGIGEVAASLDYYHDGGIKYAADGASTRYMDRGGVGTNDPRPQHVVWNEQHGNEAWIAERGPRQQNLNYLRAAAGWLGQKVVPQQTHRNEEKPDVQVMPPPYWSLAGGAGTENKRKMMFGGGVLYAAHGATLPWDSGLTSETAATANALYNKHNDGYLYYNTYYGHPDGYPEREAYSVDFWGGGGRGDPIATGTGDAIAGDAPSYPDFSYWIWNGQDSYDGSIAASDPHTDHVHTTFMGDIGLGGGGGIMCALRSLAANAIAEFMPEVPDFGEGMVPDAVEGVGNHIRTSLVQWIKDQIKCASGPGSTEEVREWIRQGLEFGNAFEASESNIEAMAGRAMQESSGDPTAVNDWDSNAAQGTPSKGLFQIIEPTWETHRAMYGEDAGAFSENWSDPIMSAAVASRYMKNVYGYIVGSNGVGYTNGGIATSPQVGMLGDNGPEAMIPLDHPNAVSMLQSAFNTTDPVGPNAARNRAVGDAISAGGGSADNLLVAGADQARDVGISGDAALIAEKIDNMKNEIKTEIIENFAETELGVATLERLTKTAVATALAVLTSKGGRDLIDETVGGKMEFDFDMSEM